MHIFINANIVFSLLSFQNNYFKECGKSFLCKTHKIKNESDNRRLKVSENKVLHFYKVLVILYFNLLFFLVIVSNIFLKHRPQFSCLSLLSTIYMILYTKRAF